MSTAEVQIEPAEQGDQKVTPLELFFDLRIRHGERGFES